MEETLKKKRGRPPKVKEPKKEVDFLKKEENTLVVGAVPLLKKKRGRPPKTKRLDLAAFILDSCSVALEVSRKGRSKKQPSKWPQFGFEKVEGKLKTEDLKKIQMFPYFCEEDFTELSVVKPTVNEAADALNNYLVSQGFPKRYRD